MDESTNIAEAKRAKRKRILIWGVGITALLTVVWGNYGAYQIYKINRQKSALAEEIDKLKKINTELLEQREKIKTDLNFIERIAREKYSMIREGEKVYQMIPNEKVTTKNETKTEKK